MTVQASSVPYEVSKRKESLKLIYQPSVHWLGGITVLCILGIAASSYFPQSTSVVSALAVVAGIAVGALAKVLDSPTAQPPQQTQG